MRYYLNNHQQADLFSKKLYSHNRLLLKLLAVLKLQEQSRNTRYRIGWIHKLVQMFQKARQFLVQWAVVRNSRKYSHDDQKAEALNLWNYHIFFFSYDLNAFSLCSLPLKNIPSVSFDQNKRFCNVGIISFWPLLNHAGCNKPNFRFTF